MKIAKAVGDKKNTDRNRLLPSEQSPSKLPVRCFGAGKNAISSTTRSEISFSPWQANAVRNA
jgi:hypothetical protein